MWPARPDPGHMMSNILSLSIYRGAISGSILCVYVIRIVQRYGRTRSDIGDPAFRFNIIKTESRLEMNQNHHGEGNEVTESPERFKIGKLYLYQLDIPDTQIIFCSSFFSFHASHRRFSSIYSSFSSTYRLSVLIS